MGAGCGLGILKAVLCVLNVAISGLGIGVVVVGALVLTNSNLHEVKENLQQFSNYTTAATVVLASGVVVVLFGLCGCCGACFGIGWLLLSFTITMAIFIVVEMVVMGLVWKYASGDELETTLTVTLTGLIEARKSGLPNFLHDVQTKLHCCGAKGPEDYRKRGLEIPPGCYDVEDEYMPRIRRTGCGKAVAVFLGEQSLKVGLVTLAIVLAQVVAIVIAVMLYCKL